MAQETLNDLARAFSRRYPVMYDEAQRRRKGRKIARVLKHALAGQRIENLLDIGTSNAVVLDTVCAELDPTFAVGVDMDAAELPPPTANRIACVGNAMSLPLGSNRVDVVICNHIYEHVDDVHALFAEMYRVLKPGGLAYFGAMNALWPIEPHYHLPFIHWLPLWATKILLRRNGRTRGYLEKPLGLRQLKKLAAKFEQMDYTIRIIMAPASFAAEDVVPYPRWGRLYAIFARLCYGLLPGYIWILRKRG